MLLLITSNSLNRLAVGCKLIFVNKLTASYKLHGFMGFLPIKQTLAIRSYGFTLIELLVTIAMLSLITALAIPSVSTFMQRQEIASSSQAISSMFSLARSEALNRLSNISVCWVPSTGAANVVSGFTVQPGQMVVLTVPNAGGVNATEIRSVQYDTGSLALTDSEGAGACIQYTAQGRINLNTLAVQPLLFRICQLNGTENGSENVQIQLAGRPLVIDNEALAVPLDCV